MGKFPSHENCVLLFVDVKYPKQSSCVFSPEQILSRFQTMGTRCLQEINDGLNLALTNLSLIHSDVKKKKISFYLCQQRLFLLMLSPVQAYVFYL